ncbi:MAG TPA: hypothetical protein VIY86_14530 [Pirellulaceae bacterium]
MKLVLGSVIAAVAAFVWGFVFWQVLPWPMQVMRTLPNQDEVVDEWRSSELATGVYLVPGMTRDMTDAEFKANHMQGPIATLLYQREGSDPANPQAMIRGFVHMWISAFILGIVLLASGRREFFGRFMLAFWIGIFVAIWTEPTRAIWFSIPWEYSKLYMAYHFSACVIMGLVLSWFVRPMADPALD